jgi:hypothetical protein
MRKPKMVDPWMNVRFLLVLSDGRSRGFMEIVQKLRMQVGPTSQMFVDRLASPLCRQGLVKSTLSGYKITDVGLAWLKREGLEITRQAYELPTDYVDTLGEDPLEALRKLHDL